LIFPWSSSICMTWPILLRESMHYVWCKRFVPFYLNVRPWRKQSKQNQCIQRSITTWCKSFFPFYLIARPWRKQSNK
jgi:hypothetical protein